MVSNTLSHGFFASKHGRCSTEASTYEVPHRWPTADLPLSSVSHKLTLQSQAAFNVTALSDLGYDEKTSFIDPMEQRYRAKPFSDTDLSGRTGDFSDASIQAKMAFFNGLDAYRNVVPVESRLDAYWATHTATTLVTSTTKGGGGSATSTSSSAKSVSHADLELDFWLIDG